MNDAVSIWPEFRVVHDDLAHCLTDALHHAAMDLAGDNHRIEDFAKFFDGGIAHDLGDAGIGIDFDLANMRAVREGDRGGLEFATFGQAAFLARRNEVRIERGTADTGDIDRAIGAGDVESSLPQFDVR